VPGDTWQQERQVRLTAQRILSDHLSGDWDIDELFGGPQGRVSGEASASI
jgi:hypothetical protein